MGRNVTLAGEWPTIALSVFIGSSVEGQHYAAVVARVLAMIGADPRPWWSPESFPANRTIIESLARMTELVDAALMVATPDDETSRRGETFMSPTMNVVLEYGLFTGHLGRDRVAIIHIGDTRLPSDLGGVIDLRVQPRSTGQDESSWAALAIEPVIRSWLRSVELSSSNGQRLSQSIERLVPDATPTERIRIKNQILRKRLSKGHYSRLPETMLADLLAKYTLLQPPTEAVGYRERTSIRSYIDLTKVPSGSDDERVLAGHLASHIAAVVDAVAPEISVIALSKVGANTVVRSAAALTPFPILTVNVLGPNRLTAVEGYAEPGEEVAVLHDVVLSGHHLVDCVTALRRQGLRARHVIALIEYATPASPLNELFISNDMQLHPAALYRDPVTAELSVAAAGRHCLLCDVLNDRDDVPFRQLFTRAEAPSERLIESAASAAIADVAPIAPGHTLIVPHRHALALAHLEEHELDEVLHLRNRVVEHLEARYELRTISFEHGMCVAISGRGCGIDHAHLHVLPFDAEVTDRFKREFKVRHLSTLHELRTAVPDATTEYLLLINQAGDAYFTVTLLRHRSTFGGS